MSSGKVLLGFLAGIAAGALLGILLAPDKGSETRKKIGEKGKDLAEDLSEKLREFVAEVSDKFESVANDMKESAGHEPNPLNHGNQN